MNKILLTLLLALLAMLALCSCGDCKHRWKTDDCEEGMTCSLCGDTKSAEHDWKEANCVSPKTCRVCKKTEGDIGDHIWSEETCLKSKSCSICKRSTDPIPHDWQDATCYSPKTCARCNLTEGEIGDHEWSTATCLEPSVCRFCNLVDDTPASHRWVFVDCETPRYCKYCSTVEEDAPGHKWIEATCTDASYCNKCKVIKGTALGHAWQEPSCTEPKNCSRCMLTEGEPLGHKWTLSQVIAPSCSVGKEIYTCICGETDIITSPASISYHKCDTDGTCTVCNTKFDTSKMTLKSLTVGEHYFVEKEAIFTSSETTNTIYKPLTYEDIGMPIIDLNGDISKVSKSYVVTIPFSYNDGEQSFECFAEVKVQGASSAGYPKKNYSIKLVNELGEKNKVKLVKGWGKQHKYCMKANYVDFSQARNVVSAQIFGDIVRSRGLEDELSKAPNGGAIDGFPILVYNEGDFLGLYTMNIPKDKWMFDMKDSDEKNQAILMGEHWNSSVAFRQPMSYNMGSSGWELEYASNEDSLIDNSTSWVVDSMNRVINFVINNDGQAFIDGIDDYIDVDKCIDTMIYTFFICADDNLSKNILWVTFDGKIWFSSVYDMDGTWGMKWNGSIEFNENTHLISNLAKKNNTNYNLLWERLYDNFYDRIVERYKELREGPLSISNISSRFIEFFNKIPDIVYDAEKSRWPSVPSHSTNNFNQIITFANKRIEKMDDILINNNLE